jgi:hypothetical protein
MRHFCAPRLHLHTARLGRSAPGRRTAAPPDKWFSSSSPQQAKVPQWCAPWPPQHASAWPWRPWRCWRAPQPRNSGRSSRLAPASVPAFAASTARYVTLGVEPRTPNPGAAAGSRAAARRRRLAAGGLPAKPARFPTSRRLPPAPAPRSPSMPSTRLTTSRATTAPTAPTRCRTLARPRPTPEPTPTSPTATSARTRAQTPAPATPPRPSLPTPTGSTARCAQTAAPTTRASPTSPGCAAGGWGRRPAALRRLAARTAWQRRGRRKQRPHSGNEPPQNSPRLTPAAPRPALPHQVACASAILTCQSGSVPLRQAPARAEVAGPPPNVRFWTMTRADCVHEALNKCVQVRSLWGGDGGLRAWVQGRRGCRHGLGAVSDEGRVRMTRFRGKRCAFNVLRAGRRRALSIGADCSLHSRS